jgi:tetratricopeptide (TPR) repeat protein
MATFVRPVVASSLVFVICLCLSLPAGGALRADDGRVPLTRDAWQGAVDAYIDGRFAAAHAVLRRVDPITVVEIVRNEAEVWRDMATVASARRLKAAAALTFEASLMSGGTDDDTARYQYLDLGREIVRRLEDSERAAERAGRGATREWRTGAFAAVWRLNQWQFLLLLRQFTQVDRTAQRGDLALLPEPLQAEWHMTRGMVHETVARLWLGPANLGAVPTYVGPTGTTRASWIERARNDAVRHYREALAVQPAHAETHLRLGRVLFEQGKDDEGRAHLGRAATEPCSDAVCGLAWLFLGEWHMAKGTTADARRAYLLASGVLDVRQSALVGLLYLSMRRSPATAVDIAGQFDARAMISGETGPDAWARYTSGHVLRLPVFVHALREEVRR